MQDMIGKIRQAMADRKLSPERMAKGLRTDGDEFAEIMERRREVPLVWVPLFLTLYGGGEDELWEALDMTASEYSDGEPSGAEKMAAAAEAAGLPLSLLLQYAGAPGGAFSRAGGGAVPTPREWTDRAEELLGLEPGSLRRKGRSFVDRDTSEYHSLTSFGRRLRAWRSYYGDTPAMLDRKMKTAPGTAEAAESGESPASSVLIERIAGVYPGLSKASLSDAAFYSNNYEREGAPPSAAAARAAREAAGLTLEAAAKAAGIAREGLADIELGAAVPDAKTAKRLEAALGAEIPLPEEAPAIPPVRQQSPLAARLSRLREEAGTDADGMAAALGVSPEELRSVEEGKAPLTGAVLSGLSEGFGLSRFDALSLAKRSGLPGTKNQVPPWASTPFGAEMRSLFQASGAGLKNAAAALGVPVRDVALTGSGDADVPEELVSLLAAQCLGQPARLKKLIEEGPAEFVPGGKFDREILPEALSPEGEALAAALSASGTEPLDFLNALDIGTAAFKEAFSEGSAPPEWLARKAGRALGDFGTAFMEACASEAAARAEAEDRERAFEEAGPTPFGMVLREALALSGSTLSDAAAALGVREDFVREAAAGFCPVPPRWLAVLPEALSAPEALLWDAWAASEETPEKLSGASRRRRPKTALRSLFERIAQETGFSQGRIARDLGMPKSALSQVEKGAAPPPEGLPERVSELYGTSPEEVAEAADRSCSPSSLGEGPLTPFGKLTERARSLRRQTKAKLAETLGVSQARLSALRDGRANVPHALAERLSEAYGIPAEEAETAWMFSPWTKTMADEGDLTPFGRLVLDEAAKAGKSQEEAAALLGTDGPSLAAVCFGAAEPSSGLVASFCGAFGVDLQAAAEAAQEPARAPDAPALSNACREALGASGEGPFPADRLLRDATPEGRRIIEARRAGSLTRAEAAEALGVSESDIARYEEGEPFPPNLAPKLDAAFPEPRTDSPALS